MLRAIRTLGVEKRWVYGSIMAVVVVTFVGTMGFMGLTGSSGLYAARVDGQVLPVKDFDRLYKIRYKQLERAYGDQFDRKIAEALNLKQQVLAEMVNHQLWLHKAQHMGLAISDTALRQNIVKMTAFQVNHRFNSAHYRRVLDRNHLTAETFERSVREDLLVTTAQDLIGAAARITAADLLATPAPEAAPDQTEAQRAKQEAARRSQLLNQKRGRIVAAFTEHLHRQAEVRVYPKAIRLNSG